MTTGLIRLGMSPADRVGGRGTAMPAEFPDSGPGALLRSVELINVAVGITDENPIGRSQEQPCVHDPDDPQQRPFEVASPQSVTYRFRRRTVEDEMSGLREERESAAPVHANGWNETESPDGTRDESPCEGDHLHRDAPFLAEPFDELVFSDQDHLTGRCGGHDALGHQSPSPSLHEIEVGSDLVRSVHRDVERLLSS